MELGKQRTHGQAEQEDIRKTCPCQHVGRSFPAWVRLTQGPVWSVVSVTHCVKGGVACFFLLLPCCVDGFFDFIWRRKLCRKLVHPDRGGTLGRAVYQTQGRMWHIRSFAVESPIFTECNMDMEQQAEQRRSCKRRHDKEPVTRFVKLCS